MIKFKKFIRNTQAATAVEFALVFPILFFFLLAFIEFGIIMFGNAMLDSAITRASRRAMTGCIENDCQVHGVVTPKQFLEDVEFYSGGYIDTGDSEKFKIIVRPIEDGDEVLPIITASPGQDDGNGGRESYIDLGQGKDVVIYYAEYRWDLILPFVNNLDIIGFHELFFNFPFVTVVRNEDFAPLPESQRRQ